MPERKVKAAGRRVAGLARALLALAAPLALAACLPAMARNSAPPPEQFRPAPAVPVLAEVREFQPDIKGATPLPSVPVLAEVRESGLDIQGSTTPVPEPTPIHSYQTALPPQSFTFNSGLIDLYSLMAGSFPGPLVTALAGEGLLMANGLTPARIGEPDPLEEAGLLPALDYAPAPAVPVLYAPAPVVPVLALAAPAAADPAPSAGEPILSNDRPIALSSYRPAGFRVGQAGRNGDRTRNLLTAAYEQTGRHYKIGGFSPLAGFDAAGYTHWVFAREGLVLPRTPDGLAAAGVAVTKADLRPGDVLIYRNPADKAGGWHVGIYSGQGNFLHASPKAGVVTETDAFGPQYAPFFKGGRRFFDDPGAAPLSDSQKMAATSTAVKLALAELGPDDKVVRPAPPRAVSKAKAAKAKGKKAVKKK